MTVDTYKTKAEKFDLEKNLLEIVNNQIEPSNINNCCKYKF